MRRTRRCSRTAYPKCLRGAGRCVRVSHCRSIRGIVCRRADGCRAAGMNDRRAWMLRNDRGIVCSRADGCRAAGMDSCRAWVLRNDRSCFWRADGCRAAGMDHSRAWEVRKNRGCRSKRLCLVFNISRVNIAFQEFGCCFVPVIVRLAVDVRSVFFYPYMASGKTVFRTLRFLHVQDIAFFDPDPVAERKITIQGYTVRIG
jgi:hypothetical protein